MKPSNSKQKGKWNIKIQQLNKITMDSINPTKTAKNGFFKILNRKQEIKEESLIKAYNHVNNVSMSPIINRPQMVDLILQAIPLCQTENITPNVSRIQNARKTDRKSTGKINLNSNRSISKILYQQSEQNTLNNSQKPNKQSLQKNKLSKTLNKLFQKSSDKPRKQTYEIGIQRKQIKQLQDFLNEKLSYYQKKSSPKQQSINIISDRIQVLSLVHEEASRFVKKYNVQLHGLLTTIQKQYHMVYDYLISCLMQHNVHIKKQLSDNELELIQTRTIYEQKLIKQRQQSQAKSINLIHSFNKAVERNKSIQMELFYYKNTNECLKDKNMFIEDAFAKLVKMLLNTKKIAYLSKKPLIEGLNNLNGNSCQQSTNFVLEPQMYFKWSKQVLRAIKFDRISEKQKEKVFKTQLQNTNKKVARRRQNQQSYSQRLQKIAIGQILSFITQNDSTIALADARRMVEEIIPKQLITEDEIENVKLKNEKNTLKICTGFLDKSLTQKREIMKAPLEDIMALIAGVNVETQTQSNVFIQNMVTQTQWQVRHYATNTMIKMKDKQTDTKDVQRSKFRIQKIIQQQIRQKKKVRVANEFSSDSNVNIKETSKRLVEKIDGTLLKNQSNLSNRLYKNKNTMLSSNMRVKKEESIILDSRSQISINLEFDDEEINIQDRVNRKHKSHNKAKSGIKPSKTPTLSIQYIEIGQQKLKLSERQRDLQLYQQVQPDAVLFQSSKFLSRQKKRCQTANYKQIRFQQASKISQEQQSQTQLNYKQGGNGRKIFKRGIIKNANINSRKNGLIYKDATQIIDVYKNISLNRSFSKIPTEIDYGSMARAEEMKSNKIRYQLFQMNGQRQRRLIQLKNKNLNKHELHLELFISSQNQLKKYLQTSQMPVINGVVFPGTLWNYKKFLAVKKVKHRIDTKKRYPAVTDRNIQKVKLYIQAIIDPIIRAYCKRYNFICKKMIILKDKLTKNLKIQDMLELYYHRLAPLSYLAIYYHYFNKGIFVKRQNISLSRQKITSGKVVIQNKKFYQNLEQFSENLINLGCFKMFKNTSIIVNVLDCIISGGTIQFDILIRFLYGFGIYIENSEAPIMKTAHNLKLPITTIENKLPEILEDLFSKKQVKNMISSMKTSGDKFGETFKDSFYGKQNIESQTDKNVYHQLEFFTLLLKILKKIEEKKKSLMKKFSTVIQCFAKGKQGVSYDDIYYFLHCLPISHEHRNKILKAICKFTIFWEFKQPTIPVDRLLFIFDLNNLISSSGSSDAIGHLETRNILNQFLLNRIQFKNKFVFNKSWKAASSLIDLVHKVGCCRLPKFIKNNCYIRTKSIADIRNQTDKVITAVLYLMIYEILQTKNDMKCMPCFFNGLLVLG